MLKDFLAFIHARYLANQRTVDSGFAATGDTTSDRKTATVTVWTRKTVGFTVRMRFPPLLKRWRCPAGGKGRLGGGDEDCPFREGVADTG